MHKVTSTIHNADRICIICIKLVYFHMCFFFRLKENQPIDRTGMAILDVGILSGFSLAPEDAISDTSIMKVDRTPEGVILYLDSVSPEVRIFGGLDYM